jgi:ankyrin repeat protein/L-ascorbate metabolism protein UlaG (beta-lactamase superfamily)
MNNPRKAIILLVAIFLFSVHLQAEEIHEVAAGGNLDQLRSLLAQHPDWLNQQDYLGFTPLNIACREGHRDMVVALLDMGADMNLGDVDNSQPIHLAAQMGHIEIVEELLRRGAGINEQDNNGGTPLLFSVFRQQAMAEYLIDRGADINIANNIGFTPLFYTVIAGNEELLKTLIEKGADVSPALESGIVPLHSAASYGRTEIARILLENGAKVDAKTEHGETPLSWALNSNCVDVATLLIEKGAKVKHRTESNRTPLHNAAQRGTVAIAELLLEQGAEINALDDAGWTPLTMGAMANLDIVKYLIIKGAEVNPAICTDKVSKCCIPNPTTPLHMAARHGKIDIAKALIDNGAKMNVVNENGLTPLHEAVARNEAAMVDYLISRGAFVDIREETYGYSELLYTAIKGNTQIADALLEAGVDINHADNSNHTALEYALFYGFKSLAYKLLANGADDGGLVNLLNMPNLLEQTAGDKEAQIWYLGHSGWAIKTKNHFMIFDYMIDTSQTVPADASLACGHIVPEQFGDYNVYVFSSHEHWDHYHDNIFEWKDAISNIKYVLGHRPEGIPAEDYIFAAPRIERDIDDIKMTTIRSTDAGVGYLLEVDDLVIFHGGDHANGNLDFSGGFTPEIDYLAQSKPHIDIAFMGVTGCSLGDPESVRAGLFYALDKLEPNVLFPMHGGDMSSRYQEFADSVQARNLPHKIACAVNKGDRFIYSNEEIKKIDLDWRPTEAREETLTQK